MIACLNDSVAKFCISGKRKESKRLLYYESACACF